MIALSIVAKNNSQKREKIIQLECVSGVFQLPRWAHPTCRWVALLGFGRRKEGREK